MKHPLLITLPLLATSALANSFGPTEQLPAPEVPPPPAIQPSCTEPTAEELLRREYHQPLVGLLAFIYDKESADAAAPCVVELLAHTRYVETYELKSLLRRLRYGCDYYGSSALQEALAALQHEESVELQQHMKEAHELYLQVLACEAEYCQLLEAVCDDATATRAAEAMVPFMKRMEAFDAESSALSDKLSDSDDGMRAFVFQQKYQLLSRFLHTYGKVQASREGGYPVLKDTLRNILVTALGGENISQSLTREIDALLADAARNECEQHHAAMREWLRRAATTSNKEEADALADWLEQQRKELEFPLGRKLRPAYCICREHLEAMVEQANTYMQYAMPGYYGSQKLETQLKAATSNR